MNETWKIAVAVRDDLETWQKLNLTAFVASGIGPSYPTVIGDNYVDASNQSYLPMFAMPVLIYLGDHAGLSRAFDRAVGRGLAVSVYTEELFSTGNDIDNRAAVAAVQSSDLNVAGFSVAGMAKQVDKVFDKLKFHP